MSNLIILLNKFQSDNKAYIASIELACTEANQGKAPTIDKQGRYHAPCNGYEFNGSIYAAGEYMSDEFAKVQGNSKAKVKVQLELVDSIKAVWSCVSFGKSWTANSVNVCYAYFEQLTQAQVKALESGVTSNKKTYHVRV